MEYTLNCNGHLLDLHTPLVMGILNVTPDSFYAGSRTMSEQQIIERTRQILQEGGSIIDVGACSTRPGSEPVSQEEEMERLRFALGLIRKEAPDAVVSVDTFRPDVARMVVEEYGADIINDVGNCQLSIVNSQSTMFRMVSRLHVPYILMSQEATMRDMLLRFAHDVDELRSYGQKDIILDPGFGFGKTLEQNYAVASQLEQLQILQLPILVGFSRKSMIYRLLGTQPEQALNGTSVLNTISLTKGASILRVHDVREAVECVRIVESLEFRVERDMLFEFGIKDIIDIVLVALMLYYIYRLMKASRSMNIFIGIMVFVVLWLLVSQVLEMRLLGSIMDKLVSVGVIALIVLFQEDIRKFLFNLGAHRRIKSITRFLGRDKQQDSESLKKIIMPIVMSCLNMSKRKVGALIVIERDMPLDDVVNTGERIDARISQQLIENIFFKNSPLHDGAMIISHSHIKAAGCILPVSHNLDIPKELGLRHRAALGISQESDCIAIVVSEETGGITIAMKGDLKIRLSGEKLESILTKEMM